MTLADGNVLTITGTGIADQHWIQVTPSQDVPLAVKTRGRAFKVASYRYDAIFKPLEQLLVQKEPPITRTAASPAAHGMPAAHGPQRSLPVAPLPAPAP